MVDFTTMCAKVKRHIDPFVQVDVWHLWSVADIDGSEFIFEDNYLSGEISKDDALIKHDALARQAFDRLTDG